MPGRKAFSIFTFDKRDKIAVSVILILGIYTLTGALAGYMYFSYFPYIKWNRLCAQEVSVFTAYLILCMYPVIIEFWEVIKWNAIKSKI